MRRIQVKGRALGRNLLARAYTEGAGFSATPETDLQEYKRVAERRMRFADAQPTAKRQLLWGLHNRISQDNQARDLSNAWQAGCRTQEEAEEWFRKHYGPSAVELRQR